MDKFNIPDFETWVRGRQKVPKKLRGKDKCVPPDAKLTEKMYTSTSADVMGRPTLRKACEEGVVMNSLARQHTPLKKLDEFWKKWQREVDGKLLQQYVRACRPSIPRAKMNTNSFATLMRMPPVKDLREFGIDDHMDKTETGVKKAKLPCRSEESILSSSTVVSETHDDVPLESGWDDDEDYDIESDDGGASMAGSVKNVHHGCIPASGGLFEGLGSVLGQPMLAAEGPSMYYGPDPEQFKKEEQEGLATAWAQMKKNDIKAKMEKDKNKKIRKGEMLEYYAKEIEDTNLPVNNPSRTMFQKQFLDAKMTLGMDI